MDQVRGVAAHSRILDVALEVSGVEAPAGQPGGGPIRLTDYEEIENCV
jgi:hypothetical protein